MRWKNRATRWEWEPGVWVGGPPYPCLQIGPARAAMGVGGRRKRARRRAEERRTVAEFWRLLNMPPKAPWELPF